jgi:hypothetical protein
MKQVERPTISGGCLLAWATVPSSRALTLVSWHQKSTPGVKTEARRRIHIATYPSISRTWCHSRVDSRHCGRAFAWGGKMIGNSRAGEP